MRCLAGRRVSAEFPHDKFTIRRAPHNYKRPIKCPHCRSEDVVDFEDQYIKNESKREQCYCASGPPHPHRKGSHRLCEHHALANVPLTHDEELHYMGVFDNQRRTSTR